MADLELLLHDIQIVQREILRTAPYRDFGAERNPGASKRAIKAAEKRIGRKLPPSYREFLRISDGWPRFYDGATLLGTANLGIRAYDEATRATFEAAETPEAHLVPASRFKPRILIPFGIDLQATTLFVFNPSGIDVDGEMEVIAWINELGLRRSSFGAFLETILELCEAELGSYRERVDRV